MILCAYIMREELIAVVAWIGLRKYDKGLYSTETLNEMVMEYQEHFLLSSYSNYGDMVKLLL